MPDGYSYPPGMGNLRPIENNVPWATTGPVPSYFISLLKSRIEQVPDQFLLNAGITQEEISKIKRGAPITWQEYSALTTKIWNAEVAYNSSLWGGTNTSPGIKWPPPSIGGGGGGSSDSSSIPTWLILMLGMVMVLVVIVVLLRRT
jgi:hypothetical protein